MNTLIAAAGLAGVALAQSARPASAVSPEKQQLAVWYGDWTYTGETFAMSVGSAGWFTGSMTGGEWHPTHLFALCDLRGSDLSTFTP